MLPRYEYSPILSESFHPERPLVTATMAPAMQIGDQAQHLNVGFGAVGSVAIPATESDHGEVKLVPTLNGVHAIHFVHPVGKDWADPLRHLSPANQDSLEGSRRRQIRKRNDSGSSQQTS